MTENTLALLCRAGAALSEELTEELTKQLGDSPTPSEIVEARMKVSETLCKAMEKIVDDPSLKVISRVHEDHITFFTTVFGSIEVSVPLVGADGPLPSDAEVQRAF